MSEQAKILLLEDEVDLRDLVSWELAAVGWIVRAGADGIEGLQIMENFKPDLIITDLMMPRMGGIEFLEEVRRRFGQMPPSIITTGFVPKFQRKEELNIVGILEKPSMPGDMIKMATRMISQRA